MESELYINKKIEEINELINKVKDILDDILNG